MRLMIDVDRLFQAGFVVPYCNERMQDGGECGQQMTASRYSPLGIVVRCRTHGEYTLPEEVAIDAETD